MKKLDEFLEAGDGEKLAASVFLPGEGKYPVLLAMTPYGREQLAQVAKAMTSRGFAVVVQDVRGRYDSTGSFSPVKQEREDGPATIDWIEKQRWYDEEKGIGIIGISYLSLVGFLAAAKRKSIKAMFNAGGLADSFDLTHRGGAIVLHHALPWSIIIGHGKTQPDLGSADWEKVFKTQPLEKADRVAGYPSRVWQELCTHKIRDDFWEELSAWQELRNFDFPILHFTGWYDICLGPTLDIFNYFQEKSEFEQQLFIGPWSHSGTLRSPNGLAGIDFGPEGKSDLFQRGLNWFAHFLAGKKREKELHKKPVNLFITGENKWHCFNQWPPEKAKERKLFLRGGSLGYKKETTTGEKSFIFDPAQPPQTVGGAVWEFPAAGLEPGPLDQSPVSRREDVITFSSPKLKEDLTLAGPAECRLFGSVDGESGDWVVRIVDLAPNGKRRWVADGILRSHFREGPRKVVSMVPGRVESLKIDLWAIGHTFKKGHRLCLEISGGSFPKWDLNLIGLREQNVRKQKIHWGKDFPSYLKIFELK